MVEHRQPICKLAFERMSATPDVLYGEDVGSNYQGQVTMLVEALPRAGGGRGAERPTGLIRPARRRGRSSIGPMPNIGPLELAIVLVIALVIFGPKRLPDLGKSLGSGMREFKDSLTGKRRRRRAEQAKLEAAAAQPQPDDEVEPVKGEVVADDRA